VNPGRGPRRIVRDLLPAGARRPLGRAYRFALRAARGIRRRFSRRLDGLARRLPERRREGIPERLLATRRRELAAKRTYGQRDLDRLRVLLERADEVVPIRDAFARRDDWPERFLALRHDMDHDLENSVRLAEWESEHGFKATYYVLHTDWYWGDAANGEPSRFVLRALDRIASLGHEIGVHNNAITAALRTDGDPVQILGRTLTALRRHGFDITGTVAHGDPLCHAAGYVNNEIFLECPRPALGAPDRVIAHVDEKTGQSMRVALRPVQMADLGLTHEANFVGQTHYLSDTGGKWSRPFSEVDSRFGDEGGYLQILVHPVWWALSGEPSTPRPTIIEASADEVAAAAVGNPGAEPFEIVVRGDCCSRRAIDMNRDLFGGNPRMVRDEKARTDFFLDHLTVGSASREDITHYFDIERMSKSLRQYALGQTDRSTLAVGDARLLVMDDYADMHFAAWRHRTHGWKLWAHPAYIRDRVEFESDFEPVGQLSLAESIEDHVRLIEHYRSLNGPIPVLYMHQPIAFYPKLEPRAEFRSLGLELERAMPDLYFADIHSAELGPDDMGSCGPGQTLHFSGPTYRKMIQVALEKGLAEWLKKPRIDTPS
jgi:hypothetical protein